MKKYLLAAGMMVSGLSASAESWIYPTPSCEARKGAGYAVKIDGADAPVSEVRQSAMPVNIRWPGHQRELDQTEIGGMVRFAFSGKATVCVTGVPRPIFHIAGYDADHRTTGVIIDGIYWNGREISSELDAPELCGPFADRPKFVRSAGRDVAKNPLLVMNGGQAECRRVEGWLPNDEEMPVKIRVACIGDSITWGYAMTNRVAECYPAQLQLLLGSDYEVRNFGDPGAGVYSHPKTDPRGWMEHPWRTGKNGAAAYAFEPDIIISNLGINDSGSYLYEFMYDAKGCPKTEPGLFRREYEELLRAFKKNGKLPRIIMWTRLGPLGKSHPAKGSPNQFVMERDLRAVAEAVGAEQLDMYTPLLPYVETPDFAADGVHPEGGAQRVIAEVTAKCIGGK